MYSILSIFIHFYIIYFTSSYLSLLLFIKGVKNTFSKIYLVFNTPLTFVYKSITLYIYDRNEYCDKEIKKFEGLSCLHKKKIFKTPYFLKC